MDINTILGILCNVGIFLFGMSIIGEGMTDACGEKMKNILSVLTKNKILSVFTGFAVTAVIQSSCATTVMVVNFIDSGLLTLSQSVGIIMGANIGTTVTSLLLSVNFSAVAPVAVFIGALIRMFSKNKQAKSIALAICGFGLIFVSMGSLETYLFELSKNESFDNFLFSSTSHIKLIFIGFIITALLQSSSATVGLLQSAASSGLIGVSSAIYILFGQNIGAVMPTLFSGARCNKEAKKAAVVHLLFNVLGTGIFILISLFTPYVSFIDKIEDKSLAISVAHMIFNVGSTLILLPFSDSIAKSADRIVERRIRVIK